MDQNAKQNERILILYLPTGGGHLSNAKSLMEEFRKQGCTNIKLYDPISPFSTLGRVLMSYGYLIASQKIPMIWKLIYRNDETRQGCCLTHLIGLVFSLYGMMKVCREYKPTRIVCTHAIPSYAVKYCAKRYNIPVSMVVTDPFDPPRLWYEGHTFDIFCYSKEAKLWMLRHGVPERRLHAYNLLVNEKYLTPMPESGVRDFMVREGFSPDKPLVLLAGGGDGLPRAAAIFKRLVRSRKEFQIAVVCGKDIESQKLLPIIALPYANRHFVKIYGFVNFMYELINAAYLVVIKAGPSLIAEALALKKPMLIASSLPGQEQPNIHWVTKNGLGFYCYKPALVQRRTEELLEDQAKYKSLKAHLDNYQFENALEHIVGDILKHNRALHR